YNKAAQLYLDLLKNLPDMPLIRERVHAKLTEIYLKNEDRQHAIEQLQAIIRDDPMNPQAYYFLGSIASEQRRLPEAAAYFSRPRGLNPDYPQAYYERAGAQVEVNKAGEAWSTSSKARQKYPETFVTEFCSAMGYGGQKDYWEAIKRYTS